MSRIVTKANVASRKNEYREYVVRAYDQHGKRFQDADYFTNDRTDACNTANAMTNNAINAFRQGFYGCSYLQRCMRRGYYPTRYAGMFQWETIACNLGDKVKAYWASA